MRSVRPVLLGVVLGLMASRTGICAKTGDWQCWPRISLEGGIGESWTVYLDEEFRIGEDMRERYFYRTDLGIGRRIAPWLTLELHYWHSFAKSGGVWVEEQRPFANLIAVWKIGSFSFRDRSRIELRIFREKEDKRVYRNALTITPPVRWTSFQIQPYVTDEIFIHLDEGAFIRNRIYVGLKGRPRDGIGIDLYYMLQKDDKRTMWYDTNVAGIKARIIL